MQLLKDPNPSSSSKQPLELTVPLILDAGGYQKKQGYSWEVLYLTEGAVSIEELKRRSHVVGDPGNIQLVPNMECERRFCVRKLGERYCHKCIHVENLLRTIARNFGIIHGRQLAMTSDLFTIFFP